jgi:peptide/nickel transport system permease protein
MSLVDYAIAVRRRPEWRRVRLQPGLWLAWAVMITALLMALAPQWFTSANPLEGIPGAQRLAPQAHYWLGTDQLGRDLWTRVVYGAVHSLSAALIAVAIGLVVGTALGTLAGALAGRVESTLMRLVDVLLAIPSLLLQLTVIILLGFGTVNAAVAVGVAAIASFARLARAEVVRVRHSDYVEAARGSGGTFSPSSGVIFCPTRSPRCSPSQRCSLVRRCWLWPPSASSATAPRRRSRSGDY